MLSFRHVLQRALCLGLAATLAVAQNTTFDRPYLETLISTYLSALENHLPSALNTTPTTIYTENSQFIPWKQGDWGVNIDLGHYRHIFSDPQSRQVAAITTFVENSLPAIYIVRIKLSDNGTIEEIETQITRDSPGAALYENMTVPESVWLDPVPVEQRISRERLVEQVNKYYSGMERNDPKGNYSFFDKDCNRIEDGLQTTNQQTNASYGHSNDTAFASLGCEAQFQTGFLGFVTKIRDRRYPVIDEERQAVVAMTIFDHNGTVRSLPSVNGTSNPIPPYFDVPRTLAATEAFRLKGDKLYRIEMTLTEVPYGLRSAYAADPPRDLNAHGTNQTVASPCDRTCLYGVLDQVLTGIVKNDTKSLPLAQGARYSENGQFLAPGDGLWETLAAFSKPGIDPYAAQFADLANGTVTYWGEIREHSTPGVLVLRVKVEGGKVTEIEAIAVRVESSGTRGGTRTLMRPTLPIEWEGTSLGTLDPVFQANESAGSIPDRIVSTYFVAEENHFSIIVPTSPTCMRRDNGRQSNLTCTEQLDGAGDAPNGLFRYATPIRDERVLVADASKGVVIAVAMADEQAFGGSYGVVPGTYMVPQMMKLRNGQIERIEGMVKWMPYGYVSGWTEELGLGNGMETG